MSSRSDSSTEEPLALPPKSLPQERPGKPGGRRDQNRKERVRALSEAGVTLFLEQGIGATTIDDITKAAGVSKGSFYRYFDSKQALVAWLMKPLEEEMLAAFTACGERLDRSRTADELMAVYEDLGGDLGRTLLEHSEVVLLYLQESRMPAVGDREPVGAVHRLITEQAVTLTDIAHRHGVLRPFPERVSALAVVGAVERLVYGLLRGEDIGDPMLIPEQLSALILDGLAARPRT